MPTQNNEGQNGWVGYATVEKLGMRFEGNNVITTSTHRFRVTNTSGGKININQIGYVHILERDTGNGLGFVEERRERVVGSKQLSAGQVYDYNTIVNDKPNDDWNNVKSITFGPTEDGHIYKLTAYTLLSCEGIHLQPEDDLEDTC